MNEFHKIKTIAHYTFREILKSKILMNVFFIGLGLAFSVFVATEFTYGVPQKIALDFGLGTLSLSCIGISIFLGSNLLTREIDSRTVYMVISRPVSRGSFIIGKIFGLIGILFINIFLLSIVTLISSYFLGGRIDPLIIWAILFIFYEALLLLLITVLLSLFLNNILATLISLVILILGHGIQDTLVSTFVIKRPFLETVLKVFQLILPGFNKLNLKDFVLYQQNIQMNYLIGNSMYVLFYSICLLLLMIFIFDRKNLD